MRELIDSEERDDLIVFEDSNIVIRTGFKSDIPKPLARGGIRLTTGKIILSDNEGNELVNIPVTGLTGINVQDRSVLDFYHNNILYTSHDPKRRFNAYKYWRAIDYLQREKYKMNLPD